MYVCMYVRNGFSIEIYGFMHSLRTFLARDAHDAVSIEVKVNDSEDRRWSQNKSRDIEDG